MSDETTKAIIERVTERYSPPRKIRSGQTVSVYYDCMRLVPSELARLAAQATGHLSGQDYDAVIGVAYTGILFAAAVAGGKQVGIFQTDGQLYGPKLSGQRVIIVDDVIMSGKTIERAAQAVREAGATLIGYACIVDRSAGKLEPKNLALFSAFVAPAVL